MRKIYDCFTFYNELDILELRLQEHWDHVDHFVISEANTTHIGAPKNYVFLDNQERFKPYMDKIIHVKVEDMPGVTEEYRINPDTGQPHVWKNCWHNERHQRNCLIRGLTGAVGNDVVILSDVDEIERTNCIDAIRVDHQHNLWTFRMVYFNYRFNYLWAEPLLYQGGGHQAFTIDRMNTFPNLSHIREVYGCCWAHRASDYDDGTEMIFQHGGWHFSSLGNSEHVANKLRNFTDYSFEEAANLDVEELIKLNVSQVNKDSKFEPVILDDYFPKTVLNNRDKYAHLILEGATQTVMDKLNERGIR
jgi:hypothetical protein